MTSYNVTFKYGEKVNYDGKVAEVVFASSYSDKITIKLEDGTFLSVNKNDLFGMNNNVQSDIEARLASYDEQIAKNKSFIKECQQLWTSAKEGIKKTKNEMNSYLASLGVTHAFQITNADQKKEYKAMRAKCSDFRSEQIRASANILHTANDTVSSVIDKGNLQNIQNIQLLA